MPGAPPAERLRKAPATIALEGICTRCGDAVRANARGALVEVTGWQDAGHPSARLHHRATTGRVLCPACAPLGVDPAARTPRRLF